MEANRKKFQPWISNIYPDTVPIDGKSQISIDIMNVYIKLDAMIHIRLSDKLTVKCTNPIITYRDSNCTLTCHIEISNNFQHILSTTIHQCL